MLIHVVVYGKSGYSVKEWMCWRIAEKSTVIFQVLDLCPALAPNTNVNVKNFRIAKFMRGYAGWRGWLHLVKEDIGKHFNPSLRQMVSKNLIANVEEAHRDRATISTFGILSVSLWASVWRQQHNREAAKRTFSSFLDAFLPSLTLDDIPWEEIVEGAVQMCTDSEVGGKCVHMRQVCNCIDKLIDRRSAMFDVLEQGISGTFRIVFQIKTMCCK